jgi:uracil-DNA glycosylase
MKGQTTSPEIKSDAYAVTPLQKAWLTQMGVDLPWIVVKSQTPEAKFLSEQQRASPVQSHEQERTDSRFLQASDGVNTQMLTASESLEPTDAIKHAPPRLVEITQDVELVESSSSQEIASYDLTQIAQAVAQCQRCSLCQTRHHAVVGQGVDRPDLMVIGEAPGEQEDLQGKPFVGRSGQLLDNMLKAIGQGRSSTTYITNVVKCRPPGNRNPHEQEIAACSAYLARQIELLAPKAVLAMGRFAAHALLKTEAPLQQLRQSTHQIARHPHNSGDLSLPVVVTYHPAYLLRRPIDKRLAWEDLKRLRSVLIQA